ncbi:hypothetical protein [Synechococcus lacustris]|uniref:hypothetical protein n=1 Tax=Synechococcus lacustris TaxID=2116544 RepID=UPI0020CB765E|nr:hypothetical protein [Synechococcus lacustris]MCP9795938.1 hypothetical protein [Synechococcus lacustris L1F-Slac]MCP9815035.1 hypothetical protein [Synechococcus lacustris L1E-Slac]
MLKLPPITNWLGCREEYQLAKYHLRNAERDIKAAMNLKHDYEIERALLTRDCIGGVYYKLAQNYKLSSREFDEASQHYEKACEIHRESMKKYDDNRPTIAKSK